MTRGILAPEEGNAAAFAERAESLGYSSVWTSELWGRDSFVALARAAERTESVTLGTAIANVYGRSPATLAQAAASLDRASDGRAVLGLGTSTAKTIEDLHGMSFENPTRRLHETVELTKLFLDGDERVSYEGENFDVADFPPLGQSVPVYAAALGTANRRATARTADGWLPHNIPFEILDEAFEYIATHAREAGRDPADLTVAPYVPAAVSTDGDEARAAVRGHIAYYVGSGKGYQRAVAQLFPDRVETVAEAWRAGERKDARAAVTDEMVEALGVAGTPETAREQFESIASLDVIDHPLVVIPAGSDEKIVEQTAEALAP